MSLVERLHLDEVVTSFPELGPTAPDGGYSWIVLFGVVFIQVLHCLRHKFAGNEECIRPNRFMISFRNITIRYIIPYYCVIIGVVISIGNRTQRPVDVWRSTRIFSQTQRTRLRLVEREDHSDTDIVRRFLELSWYLLLTSAYISTLVIFLSSFADPWTKTITDLASIPRLVGLIGVALLTTGVIASGYLATGGVGAYLASLSAGAVMGIGASFIIVQSETMLRKHFRVKLSTALTLKNIATSFGFVFVPALTRYLLEETGLKAGLLLMTITFIPTVLGTLTLRSPVPQRPSPYRLLLPSDEDNELGIKLSQDLSGESEDRQSDGVDNLGYVDNATKQERNVAPALFSEVNSMYAYQEPDEDVELFVSPILRSSNKWWKQELRVLRYFRFWAAAMTWIGVKTSSLFFWILVPALFLKYATPSDVSKWMTLPIIAGIGSFVPGIGSYWSITTTTQYRRIYFGGACWLGSLVLLGLTYANSYYWFVTCSLFGGLSINGLLSCQDLTLCEVLGNQFALCSRKLFSTFVGLGVLTFCFMRNENICLRVVALLQFLGGCYWILPPIWQIVQTRRERRA